MNTLKVKRLLTEVWIEQLNTIQDTKCVKLVTYFCCIEDNISTIWEDADGPRRQAIVHIIEHHSNRGF